MDHIIALFDNWSVWGSALSTFPNLSFGKKLLQIF